MYLKSIYLKSQPKIRVYFTSTDDLYLNKIVEFGMTERSLYARHLQAFPFKGLYPIQARRNIYKNINRKHTLHLFPRLRLHRCLRNII